MVDRDVLLAREVNSCHALFNPDIEGIENPIAFLHDENEDREGKPVTVFATDGDLVDHVSSADVFKCRRYRVDRVPALNGIEPRVEIVELECPACGARYYNSHPLYLPSPCMNGCTVHPSKMVVKQRGCLVDVASGTFIIDSKTRGKQEVPFFIDRENLDINRNHAKLQLSASNVSTLLVDAIPFVYWIDASRNRFALWITRAAALPALPVPAGTREVEFKVDAVPSDEKGFVNAVFFRNLEFMQFYLGFKSYYERAAFPDLIASRIDGRKLIIEFEYESANFDKHKHDPSIVDYIICWIDNRTIDDGVKVIPLSTLPGKKVKIE